MKRVARTGAEQTTLNDISSGDGPGECQEPNADLLVLQEALGVTDFPAIL